MFLPLSPRALTTLGSVMCFEHVKQAPTSDICICCSLWKAALSQDRARLTFSPVQVLLYQ